MNIELNTIELSETTADIIEETGAECEINLPDYHPSIMRILQSNAVPMIRSKTPRGDKLYVEGSVDFTVIYLSEEGLMTSINQQTPFAHTFNIEEGIEFNVSAWADFVNARALSPRKIHVKTTVKLPFTSKRVADIPLLSPEEGNEYLTKSVKTVKRTCRGEKPLNISDELDMGGKPPIGNIIHYDVNILETEQKLLTEKMIIKADMILKVCYVDDSKMLNIFEERIPISQIMDMNGLDDETIVKVEFSLMSSKLTPRENIDGENRLLAYDIELNTEATGYKNENVQLICDAFNLKNECECVGRILSLEHFVNVKEDMTLNESLDLGVFDEIYDLSVTPRILNLSHNENTLFTAGVWNCVAIIKDGEGEYSVVERSLPFSFETRVEPCEALRSDCKIAINASAFTATDSSHVEFRLNYTHTGMLFITEKCRVLSDIKMLGEKKPNPEAILYYAEKGESLWDIAKKYSNKLSDIKEANDLTSDICENAGMIMICG